MIKAGKPAKVAFVAIMRKLLILANALIRDQRKWSQSPLDQHGHSKSGSAELQTATLRPDPLPCLVDQPLDRAARAMSPPPARARAKSPFRVQSGKPVHEDGLGVSRSGLPDGRHGKSAGGPIRGRARGVQPCGRRPVTEPLQTDVRGTRTRTHPHRQRPAGFDGREHRGAAGSGDRDGFQPSPRSSLCRRAFARRVFSPLRRGIHHAGGRGASLAPARRSDAEGRPPSAKARWPPFWGSNSERW